MVAKKVSLSVDVRRRNHKILASATTSSDRLRLYSPMSDSVTFNIAFREKERIHSFPVTVPRQYNTRLDGYNLYSAVIQVAHYLQSNQLLDFNEVRNLVYKIIAHDWSSQQAAFDDILHWPASRINTFDDQIIPKDPPSVQGTNAYRVHLLVMWERTFGELISSKHVLGYLILLGIITINRRIVASGGKSTSGLQSLC